MTKPKRSKQFPPENVTPRLPEFSWATLPVGWHSSNSSGVWSPEDTRVLSKYAIITLEKMQGIDTVVPAATRARKGLYWCQNINNESDLSACQIPTALRGTDDQHRDAAKAIKSFNPRAVVLSYLNSVIQYPWYGAARSLASHPDWWLRNSTGGIMHNLESGRPANESWLTYDHSVPAAASAWSKACLDLTASGDIDGCYVDGCTKVPHPLAPAKQTAYGPAKMAMLVALQKQVPAPLICGSNGKVYPGLGGSQIQNWGKAKKYSKREIPMLMTAMKAGVLFEAHGSAVCHAGGDPHDAAVQTELAAFLVAADRYAYYMCRLLGNDAQSHLALKHAQRPATQVHMHTHAVHGAARALSGIRCTTCRSARPRQTPLWGLTVCGDASSSPPRSSTTPRPKLVAFTGQIVRQFERGD